MRFTNNLRRRAVTWATAGLAVTAVAGALSLTAASAAPAACANPGSSKSQPFLRRWWHNTNRRLTSGLAGRAG